MSVKPRNASDVLELANQQAHNELKHLHEALRQPSRFRGGAQQREEQQKAPRNLEQD